MTRLIELTRSADSLPVYVNPHLVVTIEPVSSVGEYCFIQLLGRQEKIKIKGSAKNTKDTIDKATSGIITTRNNNNPTTDQIKETKEEYYKHY
jgi:hypothetical protein